MTRLALLEPLLRDEEIGAIVRNDQAHPHASGGLRTARMLRDAVDDAPATAPWVWVGQRRELSACPFKSFVQHVLCDEEPDDEAMDLCRQG